MFCLVIPKQNLLGNSMGSDSSIIDLSINGKNYLCFDSSAKARVIDSSIALMKCREVVVAKNKTIYALIDEYNESRNEIIRYKEIVALQNEKEVLYKEHESRLEKKIKRTKFKGRFFGTISIIGAGIGGYLIGKQ